MEKRSRFWSVFAQILSYVMVAVVASSVTAFLAISQRNAGMTKLEQLQHLIDQRFIGEADKQRMEDAAAGAMVDSLGDPWSYYISAKDYSEYLEQVNNVYVGIGVTIRQLEDKSGFEVLQLENGGAAKDVGILPGDIIVEVEGQAASVLGMDGAKALIRGQEGTTVSIGVLRQDQKLTFSVPRKTIQIPVAESQMLAQNIGYIKINNFDSRCAEETLAAVDALVEQGAQSLIFDVRNNPGGYKHELVKILDYLLPAGKLFQSVDYTGKEEIDTSDAKCLMMPMAVLINENSYSAAEFFAAALNEYDWAVVVGTATTGKGYFQNTFMLNDGSAVGLSVGKYFTPNGVSLAEVGGLDPEVTCDVDKEMAAKIYSGLILAEEDPQVQAAVQALQAE